MDNTNSEFLNKLPEEIQNQIEDNSSSNAYEVPGTVDEQQTLPLENVSTYEAPKAVVEQVLVESNDVPEGFISEAFQNALSNASSVPPSPINLAPVVVSNVSNTNENGEQPSDGPVAVKKQLTTLDRIVVDLNNIEIVDKSPLLQASDEKQIFHGRSAYQVTALQSAYIAYMSALTMRDINSITDSNVDLYTHKTNVYRAIHNHMENTNLGKIGFTDWLRITSYHDIETLEYGIYCQTFPEKNEFDVTCGSCGKKTGITVDNATLVQAENEGLVVDRIMEIIRSVNTPAELDGKSMVHTTTRVMLPNSKIIVDINTPSLYDHLEILKNIDQKLIEQESTSVSLMLFIKNMYMMDVDGSIAAGKAKYYPLRGINKLLETISNLSHTDGLFLEKSIEERIRKYSVTFSVKNQKCSHCNDNLGSLPIEIEQALFTLIQRGRTA